MRLDPLAFAHTARVMGGVDGEIVPLPLAALERGAAEATREGRLP